MTSLTASAAFATPGGSKILEEATPAPVATAAVEVAINCDTADRRDISLFCDGSWSDAAMTGIDARMNLVDSFIVLLLILVYRGFVDSDGGWRLCWLLMLLLLLCCVAVAV